MPTHLRDAYTPQQILTGLKAPVGILMRLADTVADVGSWTDSATTSIISVSAAASGAATGRVIGGVAADVAGAAGDAGWCFCEG